jgi:hypothetical protein
VKNTASAVFIASLVYNSHRLGQSSITGQREATSAHSEEPEQTWGNTSRFKQPTHCVEAAACDWKTL